MVVKKTINVINATLMAINLTYLRIDLNQNTTNFLMEIYMCQIETPYREEASSGVYWVCPMRPLPAIIHRFVTANLRRQNRW